jgi:hypothetical protein
MSPLIYDFIFSLDPLTGVDDTAEAVEERPIYTLYTQDGAPCIMIKTDAIFNLNYRTLRHGIKSVRIVLPGRKAFIAKQCMILWHGTKFVQD